MSYGNQNDKNFLILIDLEFIDSARNWIHQNRDSLLEELDSDFIESIDGVPSDATDKGKSRNKRNQIFLDFALQNNDVVMKLHKQMVEIIKPE